MLKDTFRCNISLNLQFDAKHSTWFRALVAVELGFGDLYDVCTVHHPLSTLRPSSSTKSAVGHSYMRVYKWQGTRATSNHGGWHMGSSDTRRIPYPTVSLHNHASTLCLLWLKYPSTWWYSKHWVTGTINNPAEWQERISVPSLIWLRENSIEMIMLILFAFFPCTTIQIQISWLGREYELWN